MVFKDKFEKVAEDHYYLSVFPDFPKYEWAYRPSIQLLGPVIPYRVGWLVEITFGGVGDEPEINEVFAEKDDAFTFAETFLKSLITRLKELTE